MDLEQLAARLARLEAFEGALGVRRASNPQRPAGSSVVSTMPLRGGPRGPVSF